MNTGDSSHQEMGWQVRHTDGGVLRVRTLQEMAALIERGVVNSLTPVRSPESTRFQRAALVSALGANFSDGARARAAAAPSLSVEEEGEEPPYRAAPETLARALNDAERRSDAAPPTHGIITATEAQRDRQWLASCGTAVIRLTWIVCIVIALFVVFATAAQLKDFPGQALFSIVGGLLWTALLAALCLGLGYGMRVFAYSSGTQRN